MPLTHEAFFYSSDKEFTDRLAPFLRDAVASNHGAVAVATERRIELLRKRLGGDADSVSFFDANGWYRRPGAALIAWRDALDQQLRDGVGMVRAIGEIQYGNDGAAIRNWARYESLVNRGFAGHPVWLVCAYNTEMVPPEILAEARRTHPVTSTHTARTPSAPHFAAHELGAVLAPADNRADAQERSCVMVAATDDLTEVRRSVRWEAQSAGLAVDTVDDLLLAVSELLAKSLSDGGPTATIRTARQDGEWFCEIQSRRVLSNAIGSESDDLALLIGRVISDRVEVADDADGSLVRFVFGKQPADPRQRIISAASELFRANGARTTGINTVIAHAGVAKATFYANFQSKDDLIRLWLRSPAARWFDQVVAEVEARSQTAAERLTTFFDVLGDWLAAGEFRGCPFLNTATEFRNADHAFAQELADLTREIELYFRRTAAEAGFSNPDAVAEQMFLLVPGAITTSTARASVEPVRVARATAESLLASAARS